MEARRTLQACLLGTVALAVVSATACHRLAAGPSSGFDPPASAKVLIQGFMFQPQVLTVKSSTVVTWVNEDDEPHSVISANGLFRSGALDTGMTYAYRFAQPGTYRIFCSLHPQMVATIVVE